MEKNIGNIEELETLDRDVEGLRNFINNLNNKHIHIDDLKQLRKEYIGYNIQMSKSELLLRQEYINDFIKYIESRG